MQFELMAEARKSLTAWLERRKGSNENYVFPSRIDEMGNLCTHQYARLVDAWVTVIGLDRRNYGTHSLRQTKASLIHKVTGNLRAV